MWVHDLETAEFHYPIWVTRMRQTAYIISKTHRLNYNLRIWGSYQLFPLEKVASFLQKKCQRSKDKTKKIHLIWCLLKENNPSQEFRKKITISCILSSNKTIKKSQQLFEPHRFDRPIWSKPWTSVDRWCNTLFQIVHIDPGGSGGTQLLLFLLFGKDFVVRKKRLLVKHCLYCRSYSVIILVHFFSW